MSDSLRSAAWFEGDDEVAMLHRVALPAADQGKPLIGIADASSDLNPCHVRHAGIAAAVADGVRGAGGVPVRFGVMSLGEDLMKPSAMLYRNLVAMEIEETARANPLDGLVLLAGCDKSVPGALMAAASIDLPTLLALAGARAVVPFRGRTLGTGTDLWRALEERRAGRLDDSGWRELEQCLGCAGGGTCNTMGTASSMAAMTEALGMALPGWTGVDAGGEEIIELARRTGQELVGMVRADIRPSRRMSQPALDNAVRLLAAIGGSTNAVVHLAAIAGRLGLEAGLDHADKLWRDVPLVADVEPCGRKLIADFHAAGGVAAVFARLPELFDLVVSTADGRPWRELVDAAPGAGAVIRAVEDTVQEAPVLAAVFGNLAPEGAVVKVAGASPELLVHEGPALVLDDYATMRERLDDPDLDVGADVIIVLRGIGPVGAPGMPEWGMTPIPTALLARGVRDVVRITDGRMSGTSYGTVALHVAPEAAVGGALALVRDGDRIRLDVPARRLDLLVSPDELAARRAGWQPPASAHLRGWPALYQRLVMQAPQGCDFDILTGPTDAHRVRVEPTIGRS